MAGFGVYWAESARQIPDKGGSEGLLDGDLICCRFPWHNPSYNLIRDSILRLCHRLIACSIDGRSQAPKKVTVTDLFYLRGMDVGSVNVSYLLARYLRLFAAGRKSGTPQQVPPPLAAHARTMPQRMARLEEHVYEILRGLIEQREVIDAMARDFSRFSTWVTTGFGRMIDRARVAYTSYAQTHVSYQRHIRQRTGEASTSAAQQDPQQPDP
ncbi:hypothetical protein Tco_1272862 [Tanacetum coccineum]